MASVKKIDLTHNPIIQSPYTYLQAAGSDGSDKTVKGNHLRWDFLKKLGDNHLAKGDYTLSAPYISTLGFNRDNDYVKIFRTRFKSNYFVKVNFKVNQTTVVNTGNTRAWKYTIAVDSLTGVTTNVTVRFIDYTQYDVIRAGQTTFNTLALLNAYTGIVEIETDNKLSFYTELNVNLKAKETGYLRIESVTIPDTSDFTQKQVSCRKKFFASSNKVISCENIQYLRFDYVNADWKDLRIYCYEDYITGVNSIPPNGGWDNIGNFALTTDDNTAAARFLLNEVDGPGGHWPKFNDSNPAGEFTVNKLNYINRWRRPGFVFDPLSAPGNDLNGLQYFVHKYMELSKTDERALASIASDDTSDPTTQDISYVDMIRLMSLDFHVARLLGLGHIDGQRNLQKGSYIYCLEYKTFAKLDAPYTTNAQRTHIYMTPPVSLIDYRLPVAPALTPLTYGISVNNGTPTPTLLTDVNGYAPFGNLRFININRGPYNYEKPFGPFYYDPTEFCLCDSTQPIAHGLEYKEISEPNFRKPEISHDSEYSDVTGIPETVPILENGGPKIYTHQEEEEGTHEYRAYGINWFSRVSPLSNATVATTVFPKQSHLLPPFNLAVQLIQDEDPAEPVISEKALILTTQLEQGMLAGMASLPDNTLVRTSFDWNHVHHHAHQYADYADVLFRKAEPMVVKGKISSVSVLSGNRAQITTTSYSITSTSPVTNVTPLILAGDATKFAGSFFSSGGENFVIENVLSSGANPTFIIKQIKQINAVADPANPGQFISNETYKSPVPNDLFFTAENMGALSNWDLRHGKRIYLEKFYTNAKVSLRYSPTRVVTFDINSVSPIGSDTQIIVEKPINTGLIAGLSLEYSVKHEITAIVGNVFKITGDHTADFATGRPFRVFANKKNDGLYTVVGSTFTGADTEVQVSAISDPTNIDGLIEIVVSRTLTAINSANNSFVVSGSRVSEINAAPCEFVTEDDGTITRYVTGGIYDPVGFEPLLTTPPAGPILPEGTGFIQLKFQNYDLLPHPDPEVQWYKGTVRLKDVGNKTQVYPVTFIGNLTGTPATHLAIVIQDPGFIPKSDPGNLTGADIYTLDLNTVQTANYHPSYKLYLKQDLGKNPVTGTNLPPTAINFDKDEILPLFSNPNEGNRQTYMAIRSYDIKNDLESFLSNPVVLLAQKISLPKAPDKPNGPLYATRPDFYGKSTYTFDTKVDTSFGRVPYSVVFYKASEDRLLDILYTKEKQLEIWNNLNLLTDPKAKYDPLLWAVLFAGTHSGANFSTYTTTAGSFTWPLPDNPDFYLPYISNKALGVTNPPPSGYYVYPFRSAFNFALDQTYSVYGKPMSGVAILKSAIQDAFVALNEQPPMYSYFKTGTQTSAGKPKQRDASGNLLDPLTNDIFPMIRKYNIGANAFVRYTDYNLDGASASLYFYRALEMDDKFKFSDPSLPVGPVLMVNSDAPKKPQIKRLITRLQDNANNIPSSILFEINNYLPTDRVSRIEVYRATDEADALSIRTMKKVKSIEWGKDIIDDFSDVPFPLYGDDLYYRIVGIREVEDVEDVILAPAVGSGPLPTKIVYQPSFPSDAAKSLIVDTVNPPSPVITYTSDVPVISTQIILNNVVLSWPGTCYNGTYTLFKMNTLGIWEKIYEISSNAPLISVPLVSTTLLDDSLEKQDADGNTLFHRFRVQVVNSSGLTNLRPKELTI
jgi:hypothetical protein